MERALLRRAVISYVPRLKAIRASVTENVLGDPSNVIDVHYEWFVANPGIFVWEEQNEIVGFSAADPRDGSIWALFVVPGFEGKGIGSVLFREACNVLKAAGVHRAWLTTDPNTKAERFYRNSDGKWPGRKTMSCSLSAPSDPSVVRASPASPEYAIELPAHARTRHSPDYSLY
ncbi:GNAT family N-acetyltransferase [Rhizobium laguerreae]|uniref:GNAT family N-acetyltransferase n=2 Tax=Rhizobium/Agrobacterium group TaxID=227290 RepID=UPI001FE95078|nr:GNAT family N-acetyltransferase [Rhizobium laguerreae]